MNWKKLCTQQVGELSCDTITKRKNKKQNKYSFCFFWTPRSSPTQVCSVFFNPTYQYLFYLTTLYSFDVYIIFVQTVSQNRWEAERRRQDQLAIEQWRQEAREHDRQMFTIFCSALTNCNAALNILLKAKEEPSSGKKKNCTKKNWLLLMVFQIVKSIVCLLFR